MSSAPCVAQLRRSAAGTSVLWPAAWLETPTTCTSFSIAVARGLLRASGTAGRCRRRSRGRRTRWRSTLAPRSWPSWPSLATSMRGRRPSLVGERRRSRCWMRRELLVALVGRAVHAGDRTDRRRGGGRTPPPCASEISPTVARARAASIASSSRLPSPVARRSVSASSAAWHAASSRVARTCCEPRDLLLAHRRRCRCRGRRPSRRPRRAGTC